MKIWWKLKSKIKYHLFCSRIVVCCGLKFSENCSSIISWTKHKDRNTTHNLFLFLHFSIFIVYIIFSSKYFYWRFSLYYLKMIVCVCYCLNKEFERNNLMHFDFQKRVWILHSRVNTNSDFSLIYPQFLKRMQYKQRNYTFTENIVKQKVKPECWYMIFYVLVGATFRSNQSPDSLSQSKNHCIYWLLK